MNSMSSVRILDSIAISVNLKDPCIIFEPKTLYRAAVEEVPEQSFECTIGKADILRNGTDVTLIGWGTQIHVLNEVAEMAKNEHNIDCEVIDLVSILPWDRETVCQVSAIGLFPHLKFFQNWYLYALLFM